MKNSHWIVALILFHICSWAKAGDAVELLTFSTHSRIILHMSERVPVKWKNENQGFEVLLKGASLVDLGAPLGEEQTWKQQLEKLNDIRTGSLVLDELPEGVRLKGKWKFPIGKLALANPTMEFFDYYEKNPPRYVVDFWLKEGPTLLEVKASKHRAQLSFMAKKNEEERKKKFNRKLIAENKKKEEANLSRFCKQPLKENTDVFLGFNPVHQKVDFHRWFSVITPDADFSYYKAKKKTKEAQYVRLAIDLYGQGKIGLAIRTLDFFDSEYPRSEFRLEMNFLRANSLIKLGFSSEGEAILRKLMTDAPSSSVALHSSMYLGAKLLDQNSYLAALENYLWLAHHYSHYKLAWVFHLGAAESLYSLSQVDRAALEYRWVMDNAPQTSDKAEAAFRLGDLYLLRFQYAQALGAYFQGINYFKSEAKKYPSFYINRAESLYQLGQYDRAQESFKEFLEIFPNHPEGWRATFRLGEIEGRNLNTFNHSSREWFYTTINRYPFSPGATLARLRLIPCEDHGGFTVDSLERFFSQEAKNFNGSEEVVLKNYQDFRALAHVQGLITLGTLEQATNGAIQELENVKLPYVKNTLVTFSNNFLGREISELLAQGKKYEALKIYGDKAHLISGLENTSDHEYLLKLSQAALDLGMSKFGDELFKKYQQSSHMQAKTDLAEPTEDLEIELKNSEENFVQAKALWIDFQFSKKEANNEKIRSLLAMVKDESEYSYQKELILGIMDEKEENLKSAIEHVSRAQLIKNQPRLDAWIVRLESKIGDIDVALNINQHLEQQLDSKNKIEGKQVDKDSEKNFKNKQLSSTSEIQVEDLLGVPATPTFNEVLLQQAEFFEKLKRWGDAALVYSKALEKGLGGDQVRYQYAITLRKSNDPSQRLKGQEALEKLASSQVKNGTDDFWIRLAQESLANSKSEDLVTKNAKEGKNE